MHIVLDLRDSAEAGIDCLNSDAPELLNYLRGIPDENTRWKKTKVVMRELQEYAEQADDKLGAVYQWLKSDQCWRTSFTTVEALDEEFPTAKAKMDQKISRTEKFLSTVERYWKDEPARTWCKAQQFSRRGWESLAKFAAIHPFADLPKAANYAVIARLRSPHRQGKPTQPVLSTCDLIWILSQETPIEFPFGESDLAEYGLCIGENGFLSKPKLSGMPAAIATSHPQDTSQNPAHDLTKHSGVGVHCLQMMQETAFDQLNARGQEGMTEHSTDPPLSNAPVEEPASTSSLLLPSPARKEEGNSQALNLAPEPMVHGEHDALQNPNRGSHRLAPVEKPTPIPTKRKRLPQAASLDDEYGKPKKREVPRSQKQSSATTDPTTTSRGMFASDQQHRLFARHVELEGVWKEVLSSGTRFEQLIDLMRHIFEHGHPAKPFIPLGSDYGPTPYSEDEADYILATEADFWKLLEQRGRLTKPIVVRDRSAQGRKRILSTQEYMQILALLRDYQVSVQDYEIPPLDLETDDAPDVVKNEAARVVCDTFLGDAHNPTKPPMNCLSLVDFSREAGPDAFGQSQCGLMEMLLQLCEASDLKNLDEQVQSAVGKKPIELLRPSDLRNNRRWRIAAKAGSISDWHMDTCGLITFGGVAGHYSPGTSAGAKEEDEDVVKFWPFIPMERRAEVDPMFLKNHVCWKPPTSISVPVLSLIRYDTIVMPPGLLHAPSSVTDVSMSGGMLMLERQLMDHLRTWRLTSDQNQVTNEPPPKQTFEFLSLLRRMITTKDVSQPDRFQLTLDEKAEAVRLTYEICGHSLSCECPRDSCGEDCECVLNKVPCGMKCHTKCTGTYFCSGAESFPACGVECWKSKTRARESCSNKAGGARDS